MTGNTGESSSRILHPNVSGTLSPCWIGPQEMKQSRWSRFSEELEENNRDAAKPDSAFVIASSIAKSLYRIRLKILLKMILVYYLWL